MMGKGQELSQEFSVVTESTDRDKTPAVGQNQTLQGDRAEG